MIHDPLDAVLAALDFHRVLLENDSIRVPETRIEPGQVVPLHTHRWPAVYYHLGHDETCGVLRLNVPHTRVRTHNHARAGAQA